MRYYNLERKYRSFTGLSALRSGALLTALIITSVLFATSCRSREYSYSATRTADSLRMETAEAAAVRTVREVVYLPIAKETASVSAALDDVKHLPPGSQYAEREGRATVTVVFRNDTVIARADCDSMEQRMEEYRELAIVMAGMMMRSSEQTEQAVTAEKKTMEGSVFKTGFIWFLIGVVVGVAGVFIIRR